MDTNSWQNDQSRQKIVNKIMDTLQRRIPQRGSDGMIELNKMAMRFEEKIYTQATSQQDYLRRISLKMFSLESKANTPPFTGSSGNNQWPLDPGGMIPPQIRNQPQAPGNGLPLSGQPQPQQPLLQQNLQNGISAGGLPSSAGLAPPLSSIPMLGISHSSINNSTGQVLPTLLASTQRQVQSRQQQAPAASSSTTSTVAVPTAIAALSTSVSSATGYSETEASTAVSNSAINSSAATIGLATEPDPAFTTV